jgi:hypothetical protein
MVLTQSQKHWRAWVSALQTRDAGLRAVALEQLAKFLDYWTAELYSSHYPLRGLLNGHDTPLAESWDEVFNVDTELLIRPRKQAQVHFEPNEAWVCLHKVYFENRLGRMDWMNIRLILTILSRNR